MKAVTWIMFGFLLVLAVLSAVTAQYAAAILMLLLASSILAVAMPRRTQTKFNLADRSIIRIWEIGAYTMSKVHSVDDFETVQIKDRDVAIEGYSLPFFAVQLIGRKKQIEIYSTDDPEEAMAVRKEIKDFLNISAVSTARQE